MSESNKLAYEALRILSVLHKIERPSEAKQIMEKLEGTAVDFDSYESWKIGIQYMIKEKTEES